jgi:hypothetical protein
MILVHITYRTNPTYTETNGQPRVIKESHFYINDDKEHDMLYVHHCLLLHWLWFIDHGVRPHEH